MSKMLYPRWVLNLNTEDDRRLIDGFRNQDSSPLQWPHCIELDSFFLKKRPELNSREGSCWNFFFPSFVPGKGGGGWATRKYHNTLLAPSVNQLIN